MIAHCLAGLAGVATAEGRAEHAATLFGAVDALLAALNATFDPADQLEYDRNLAQARALLAPGAFGAAWSAGQSMTAPAAIAYALRAAPPATQAKRE
jgi:hypothetical protein